MSKNPQKHWDFAMCAGLRMVVSLSSMRARARESTKIPSATLRTRCNRGLSATQCSSPVWSPNETLRTAGCCPSIDAELRIGTSRLQPAFESRTTLRTHARSLPTRPTLRPSHSSRQWANSGPTARLPEWHSVASCDEIASPQRMGPPQKFDAPLGRGNSRAIRHSLFFMSANKGDPKHE